MLSIRLDSIDSRRFVCLDVDPSFRKSISRHLEVKCKLVNREGRKCCRFDSIRFDSALMSTRHTGSRFARHLEKNCNLVNREVNNVVDSTRFDSSALMSTRHTGSRFAQIDTHNAHKPCRHDSIS